MIFWMGFEIAANYLIQVAYAENILFKADKKKKPINSFYQFCRRIGGYHFLHNLAIQKNGEINIYKLYYNKDRVHNKLIEKLRIYTDKDDIAEMPEHVLIQTNNIDFIRELFDRGKKVSWYDVDVNFFVSEMAMFNFEHLFINVFKTKKWILPTGKTRDHFDEYGKPFSRITRPFLRVKYDSIIGYWPAILRKRVPKYIYYNRIDKLAFRKGVKPVYNRWCLYPSDFRDYYNMLSISYMLWRKSTAVNVREKSALKD